MGTNFTKYDFTDNTRNFMKINYDLPNLYCDDYSIINFCENIQDDLFIIKEYAFNIYENHNNNNNNII